MKDDEAMGGMPSSEGKGEEDTGSSSSPTLRAHTKQQRPENNRESGDGAPEADGHREGDALSNVSSSSSSSSSLVVSDSGGSMPPDEAEKDTAQKTGSYATEYLCRSV
jgi:hypothetical protein